MSEIFSLSLVAAYIAGMVALFAPCCISYLFPAYLGSVFRERRRVLFMTAIYSLGIFLVMLPVVLGAKALSTLFLRLHDTTYFFGGLMLVLVAIMSFLGIKLPMPHFGVKSNTDKPDVFSTFTMGIISGVTSACCAPVLIGVMTLSSLSVTWIGAMLIGLVYVLGMVSPLYFGALFISKKNILEQPWLRKKVWTLKFLDWTFPIFVSNIVAGIIFSVTGLAMIGLTLLGAISMDMASSESMARQITGVAQLVTDWVQKFPLLDVVFLVAMLWFVWKFFSSLKKEEKSCCHHEE